MKKLLICVLTVVMFLAVAVSASAEDFTDITSEHWAYEAVMHLSSLDIIDGYPDGTFQGEERISRYEAAVIVSRALEIFDITAEELREGIEEARDAAEEVAISSEEAAEMAEIVFEIVEKNDTEEPVKVPEELTEKQAEQVEALIKALTYELEEEIDELSKLEVALQAMETRLDLAVPQIMKVPEIETDMEELKELERVTFSGAYGLNVSDVQLKEVGEDVETVYENPYITEDEISPETTFEQSLNIETDINITEDIDLNLGLAGISHDFGVGTDVDLALTNMVLGIETPEIILDAGTDRSVNYTPYLFGDAELDGINIMHKNSDAEFFVGREVNEDDTFYLGAQNRTSVAGVDLGARIAAAAADNELERAIDHKLLGIDAAYDLSGIDFEADYVRSIDGEKEGSLIQVNAETALELMELGFNYRDVNPEFSPIMGDEDIFDSNNIYVDALNPGLRGFNVEAETDLYDMDSSIFFARVNPDQSEGEENAVFFEIATQKEDLYVDDLTVGGYYNYENNADNQVEQVRGTGVDMAYSGIEDALFTMAYDMSNPVEEDETFNSERKMTMGMDYNITDKFIFNYGYENIENMGMYEDAEKRADVYGLSMEEYPVLDNMMLDAGYEIEMIEGTEYAEGDYHSLEEHTGILSANASYALDNAVLSADFTRTSKDGEGLDEKLRQSVHSRADFGVEYNIAEDTAVNVEYGLGNFSSPNPDHDYTLQQVNAGLSLNF